jgi:hypothetical protein
MIKSKIIKVNNISTTFSEKEMVVKVGDILTGYFINWPNLGESFTLYEEPDGSGVLTTSTVTEIIDNRTFKTRNSIYKIVTVEDERDERIKIILE